MDHIGKPVKLLYYLPCHSKCNPIERCWGVLEQHWNGARLIDLPTMLVWAESMKWKGNHSTIKLNSSLYNKGIFLTKEQMKPIGSRLERRPLLLK